MFLSICIPTHHGRVHLLQEAIESILSQITGDLKDKVEICISDNAAQDGTQEMVQGYLQAHPGRFVYNRNETDLGGYNFIKVVEIASGKYCWLLGSDDQIAQGGVQKVLHTLAEHPDLAGLSVNRVNLDRSMSRDIGEAYADIVLPPNPEREHIYKSADEILLTCGLYYMYMSAHIFQSELWRQVVRETGEDTIVAMHFRHLHIFTAIVRKHPLWVWHPDKTVRYRTGNDSLVELWRINLFLYFFQCTKDASIAWSAALPGTKRSVYHALMYKCYLIWWNREVLRGHKLDPKYTFRNDLAMLRIIRFFYFSPDFWRDAFPVLITPHSVMKLRVRAKLRNAAIRVVRLLSRGR